jgi:hypothetical protein
MSLLYYDVVGYAIRRSGRFVLPVMTPEAGRQVIYGAVIILMLLVYGRGEEVTS